MSLEAKLDKVLEQQYQMLSEQSRMMYILENDEKTGRVGLVKEVQNIRFDLDKLITNATVKEAVKKRENIIYGSIGATLIFLIKWIGTALFSFLTKI